MGLKNFFKNMWEDSTPLPEKSAREKLLEQIQHDKALANTKQEPYFTVISVDINYDNPNGGAFEFEWNEYFLAKLIKAGYVGKDGPEIVDKWFQTVCFNIGQELQIDKPIGSTVESMDYGDGKRIVR